MSKTLKSINVKIISFLSGKNNFSSLQSGSKHNEKQQKLKGFKTQQKLIKVAKGVTKSFLYATLKITISDFC